MVLEGDHRVRVWRVRRWRTSGASDVSMRLDPKSTMRSAGVEELSTRCPLCCRRPRGLHPHRAEEAGGKAHGHSLDAADGEVGQEEGDERSGVRAGRGVGRASTKRTTPDRPPVPQPAVVSRESCASGSWHPASIERGDHDRRHELSGDGHGHRTGDARLGSSTPRSRRNRDVGCPRAARRHARCLRRGQPRHHA